VGPVIEYQTATSKRSHKSQAGSTFPQFLRSAWAPFLMVLMALGQ
jgi:hypothetical protein